MKDLELFDELKANITLFVAPTLEIAIRDVQTGQSAIDAQKQIREFMRRVDEQRRELTDPMKDRIKVIDAYVKSILAPLETAARHVQHEIDTYAERQESIRQAELRKAREEAERKEREAREKAAAERAELEARQREEAEARSAMDELFGDGEDDLAAARAKQEFEEKQARERAEQEAKEERESMVRTVELKQKEYDANLDQIKNARKNPKCEMLDEKLVPREFLVVTLNTAAVLASARAGVKEIPGVRIWWETKVAIGRNTYIPNAKNKRIG